MTLALGKETVEFGAATADPAASGRKRQKVEIEIGDHQGVGGHPGFGDDPSIGIDDHGISGPHFAVVLANTIAEYKKHAIVMGA